MNIPREDAYVVVQQQTLLHAIHPQEIRAAKAVQDKATESDEAALGSCLEPLYQTLRVQST